MLKSLCTVNPKTFEDEILEFKSGVVQADDFDSIWSKILGAFANNEGGVLVWGIQAQRDPKTGIDAAHAVSLVPSVDVLKQKLLEKYQFLIDPVLAGTEVISIPVARTKPQGFVVCFIPEGTHKPYRSLRAKKPYYIRINDDSVEVPHTLLRQLFAPKYDVRFGVSAAITEMPGALFRREKPVVIQPSSIQRAFRLTIENTSEVTAHDVYLLFEAKECGFTLIIPRARQGEADLTPANSAFLLANVLHPAMKTSVSVLASSKGNDAAIPLGINLFAKDTAGHQFKFTITNEAVLPLVG